MIYPYGAKVTEGGVNNETTAIRHSQPYTIMPREYQVNIRNMY